MLAVIAAIVAAVPAPTPSGPAGLAAELGSLRPQLRAAARAWDREAAVPADLAQLAARDLRLVRRLARRPRLLAPTLSLLPARERAGVRDEATAARDLARLSAGWPPHRITLGPARPATELWSYSRAAHRRFGVPVSLLAAVNYVESAFGRLRNNSVSGAQGPMQFMPATWRAYGLGGDVHDPRDAVLGAANYLHANGSPRDDARALYHYNPSPLYVDAVRRFARRISRDHAAFAVFYARPVRK